MKVALIYPRVLNFNFPPLGILYVAAVLKNSGHEVMVSDTDGKNKKAGVEAVIKFRPDVVGISLVNTTQINFSSELIRALKPSLPRAYFICGGICATVLSKYVLEDLGVDCVIRGEGEQAAKELLSALASGKDLSGVKGIAYKKGGRVMENAPSDIINDMDEIPHPARELLDMNDYLRPPGVIRGLWLERSTTIMASRGCPAHCIYCGSHLAFGRKHRRRSVGNVISEIEHLIGSYGIEGLWFIDDTFTLDKGWVFDFARKIIEEGIHIKWGCEARVDTVDLELLREMKRAGCCQLEFGVESGSTKVLSALKKGTHAEKVKRAFEITKKAGIRSLATFMVGNPQEEAHDIEMTRKLAQDIKADFTIFFFTTAYPGTELFEMAQKNRWLKSTDYSGWFVRQPPALEINFKQEELVGIRSRLQNRFILRNILSTVKDPQYWGKIFCFLASNIPAFIGALKIMLRTGNFDDFTFNFIEKARK